MADEFDIEAKHPDFEAYSAAWATMRDTIDGEDAVKAKGEAYLPMKSGIRAITDATAKDAAYEAYKARAEFPEIVSPTVTGSVGLIVSKPTEVNLPSGMDYLREKATKDGLTLEGLHQRIVTEVMRQGRYGLLPGVDEKGVFHIAGYKAETIVNWDEEEGNLSYLVLNETGAKRNPATNKWSTEKEYRECTLNEGVYEAATWTEVKGQVTPGGKPRFEKSEPVVAQRKGGGALDFIPFVAVGSTDLTMSPDDIPLYGLSKLALRAYRLDADYVTALHMTSEPTPWVSGVDKDNAPRTIGAANIWVLPEGAEAGMLEFSGAGIGAQAAAITDTLERAIIFGAQLFADNRRSAESGEAMRLRFGSQHATLRSVALTVAQGLEKALRHIAVWMGLNPDEVEVVPNLDFIDHALSAQDILALVTAWQAGAYSKETLFANLQRGEVIPISRTFEEEEEKIGDREPDLEGEPLDLEA